MSKKLLWMLLCIAPLTFFACDDGDDGDSNNNNEQSDNILIMDGVTYTKFVALHQGNHEGYINVDIIDLRTDEEAQNNLWHGFGGMEAEGVGQTVTNADQFTFSMGFNFNSGGTYYPQFASGSQKITSDGNKYKLLIDCQDQNGKRFYLKATAYDEASYQGQQHQ